MKIITNQPDRDCRAALAVTVSVIARSEMTRRSTGVMDPGSSPRMTEGSSTMMTASVIPAKAGIHARRMDPRVKPEDDEMPSFRATIRDPQVLRMCTIPPQKKRPFARYPDLPLIKS
jgi:hypothetical protein